MPAGPECPSCTLLTFRWFPQEGRGVERWRRFDSEEGPVAAQRSTATARGYPFERLTKQKHNAAWLLIKFK